MKDLTLVLIESLIVHLFRNVNINFRLAYRIRYYRVNIIFLNCFCGSFRCFSSCFCSGFFCG